MYPTGISSRLGNASCLHSGHIRGQNIQNAAPIVRHNPRAAQALAMTLGEVTRCSNQGHLHLTHAHAGDSSQVHHHTTTITAYDHALPRSSINPGNRDRASSYEEGINPELLQLLAKHARLELPLVMKKDRGQGQRDEELVLPDEPVRGSSAGGPSRRISSSSNFNNPTFALQSRRATAQSAGARSLEPQSEGGPSRLHQAAAKRKAGVAASSDAPRPLSPDLSKARKVSPHRQQQIETKEKAINERKAELEMRRRQREAEAAERAWSPPGKDRLRAQAAALREKEEREAASKAAVNQRQAASAFAEKLKKAGEKARKAKEEEDKMRAERLRQETAAESDAAREAAREAAVVVTDGEEPGKDEDEDGYDDDPDHEQEHGKPEHKLAADRVRAQKKKREEEKQKAESEAAEKREAERQARIDAREKRDAAWRAHMALNPGQPSTLENAAPRPRHNEEQTDLNPLLDVIADEAPPPTHALALAKQGGLPPSRTVSPGREGVRAKDLDAAGRAELKAFMERRQKEAEKREREEKEAVMAATMIRVRMQKEEAERARVLARKHAEKLAAAAQDPAAKRRAASASSARPAWIDPLEPAFDPADDPLRHLMRSLANVPVKNKDQRSVSAERRRRPDLDAISLRRMPNSTELALLAESNGDARARIVSVDRSIALAAAARQKEKSLRTTSHCSPSDYDATNSFALHSASAATGLSGIPEHSPYFYEEEMYEEEEEEDEDEARVIRLRDPAYAPLPLPSAAHTLSKRTTKPQFPIAAAASSAAAAAAAAGKGGIGGGGGVSVRVRDPSPAALMELRYLDAHARRAAMMDFAARTKESLLLSLKQQQESVKEKMRQARRSISRPSALKESRPPPSYAPPDQPYLGPTATALLSKKRKDVSSSPPRPSPSHFTMTVEARHRARAEASSSPPLLPREALSQRQHESSPTRVRSPNLLPSSTSTSNLNPELVALREIALGIAGRIKEVEKALLDERQPAATRLLHESSSRAAPDPYNEELDLEEPTASASSPVRPPAPPPSSRAAYQPTGSPQLIVKKPRLSFEEIGAKPQVINEPLPPPAPATATVATAPVTIRIPTAASTWLPRPTTSPSPARKEEGRMSYESDRTDKAYSPIPSSSSPYRDQPEEEEEGGGFNLDHLQQYRAPDSDDDDNEDRESEDGRDGARILTYSQLFGNSAVVPPAANDKDDKQRDEVMADRGFAPSRQPQPSRDYFMDTPDPGTRHAMRDCEDIVREHERHKSPLTASGLRPAKRALLAAGLERLRELERQDQAAGRGGKSLLASRLLSPSFLPQSARKPASPPPFEPDASSRVSLLPLPPCCPFSLSSHPRALVNMIQVV